MNITQEIIAHIEQACSQHQKLNIHQTLKIITAYRTISNDPELIDKIIQLIKIYSKQELYSATLSSRQNQIFNLIGLDFSSKEIANMLSIPPQKRGKINTLNRVCFYGYSIPTFK